MLDRIGVVNRLLVGLLVHLLLRRLLDWLRLHDGLLRLLLGVLLWLCTIRRYAGENCLLLLRVRVGGRDRLSVHGLVWVALSAHILRIVVVLHGLVGWLLCVGASLLT